MEDLPASLYIISTPKPTTQSLEAESVLKFHNDTASHNHRDQQDETTTPSDLQHGFSSKNLQGCKLCEAE